jgi:SPP1 family phage portal protein
VAIIRDRDLIPDLNDIPLLLLASCIREHQKEVARLDRLDEYYKGDHAILTRDRGDGVSLPNNKLVANHAKYITDIATGYVIGIPVKYEGTGIDNITAAYKDTDIVSHDTELEKDLSIFGRGLELYFMSSDDVPIPKVTVIDPRQIFLVVDDTVEYNSMFAVHYYQKYDIENAPIGWKVNVYTKDLIAYYQSAALSDFVLEDLKSHYYNDVPVVEIWNNEEQQGDYEQQITLIDAYNVLQSDRVNDKEQLVDAILKVTGFSFGDTFEESNKTIKLLKELKVLELPGAETDAAWLTKQLNETEVEVLKDAIKSDIHEFSMVPDMTDENFASNSSGVAMKYKLFGLEQLAVIKERYFVQGLRERLALFATILGVKGKAVDITDVTITMTRNLPEDEVTVQELVSLAGMVSNETLISQLPFVDDAAKETQKVNEQKAADVKTQQAAFDMPMDVIA